MEVEQAVSPHGNHISFPKEKRESVSEGQVSHLGGEL